MSQTFKLYRLQQLDSQIDQIHSRGREIEKSLQDDQALRQAQEQAEQASQALEATRKSMRRAEQILQDQRIKIEYTEASLYGGKVRNPKELQDLQNEAVALKRFRSVLEDRLLEVMLEEEEAATTHQAAASQLQIVRAQYELQKNNLVEEQARLKRDLTTLEGERQATANAIPELELNLYEQLRKQRRGIAVAKVSGQACSACGTTLSTALLSTARSLNQITRCESCGRILYAG